MAYNNQCATLPQTKRFSMNTAQAAGTYDVATATGGDILIQSILFYSKAVSAGLSFVSVQSNQTNQTIYLNAADGSLARLASQKILIPYNGGVQDYSMLESGQKIQFTITGTGSGSGVLYAVIQFIAFDTGATLT